MQKRVRAVIIRGNSMLLIHRVKAGEEYWVFPGGGLEEVDSSPQEGLKRECLEELGVAVEIDDLLMENGGQSFYLCRIVAGEIGTGKGSEFSRDPLLSGTYDIEWIPISISTTKNIYPIEVRDTVVALPRL